MARKSGLFHSVPKGAQEPRGTSTPQNTAVGSGSRPTRSRIGIESSAPADPYGLGRKTGNALK